MENILASLWSKQTGIAERLRIQIVVWNNNEARKRLVDTLCGHYVKRNSPTRRLELITSTSNYYCVIRMALGTLIKSDKLLVCDDDVIPGPLFVNFFYQVQMQMIVMSHNINDVKLV